MTTYPGRYLDLSRQELDSRADEAWEMYRHCRVCPHACEVDRTQPGKRGICELGDRLVVSASVRHFGEEPPLTGTRGVGNIFISSCNLSCDYCQNFQISQEHMGAESSYERTADAMLQLQSQGVHYIGWVSPSHVVPGLLKSLAIARHKGLRLPIIYNTNGYDSIEMLRLLDGVIDVYLPDLKYADDAIAMRYSHIKNYVERSRNAVLEMFRQVGPLTLDQEDGAQSGMLVRHLVLPGGMAGTWETLCFVALELSPRVPLSLMSQYRPTYKAVDDPLLSRRITGEEYQQALNMARELGFEMVYTQDPDEDLHNLPDFRENENPFPLDRAFNAESDVYFPE